MMTRALIVLTLVALAFHAMAIDRFKRPHHRPVTVPYLHQVPPFSIMIEENIKPGPYCDFVVRWRADGREERCA